MSMNKEKYICIKDYIYYLDGYLDMKVEYKLGEIYEFDPTGMIDSWLLENSYKDILIPYKAYLREQIINKILNND